MMQPGLAPRPVGPDEEGSPWGVPITDETGNVVGRGFRPQPMPPDPQVGIPPFGKGGDPNDPIVSIPPFRRGQDPNTYPSNDPPVSIYRQGRQAPPVPSMGFGTARAGQMASGAPMRGGALRDPRRNRKALLDAFDQQ